MRNPRIYQASTIQPGQSLQLDADAFGHVVRVLRLDQGDHLTLFNGDGKDYHAILEEVSKKQARISIASCQENNTESPVNIHLGQGISRGDRMDFTLQKSVELGVSEITPLFTERCGVKLHGERLEKKRLQWQKVVISACEQSGRSRVPKVNPPLQLEHWLNENNSELKLTLHPKAAHSIMSLPVEEEFQQKNIRLLVGPEGGLSDEEITKTTTADFREVLIGPRILRTETAALAVISALQCRFGDFN
jgi:16S rRNA (uracil1498-N3)-methyltransferase